MSNDRDFAGAREHLPADIIFVWSFIYLSYLVPIFDGLDADIVRCPLMSCRAATAAAL